MILSIKMFGLIFSLSLIGGSFLCLIALFRGKGIIGRFARFSPIFLITGKAFVERNKATLLNKVNLFLAMICYLLLGLIVFEFSKI